MVLKNLWATWKQCNWETQKAQLFLSHRHSLKTDILSLLPQTLQVCDVFSLFWTKNTSKKYDMFPGKKKKTKNPPAKNLQADSSLQNNCIITKAVEIMSENNWCDRLCNIKAVPEQVQQRFVSPRVPQLQEIFLLFSFCQGFDRQIGMEKMHY